MVFSDSTNLTGIVEQTRAMMRVDSTQWPTSRVVNSCNNWLDTVTGYAIGADRNFQWDDSNHSKLPIGTTDLTASQKDYSFLTDEQGNSILNLTRIDMLDSSGNYTELELIDQSEIDGALDEKYSSEGLPLYYDKIADNIIRLYPTPDTTVSAGLKFYFQRTGSYFAATDVSPLLHRGFVIASAYDGALTLGLESQNALFTELAREEAKMRQAFAIRSTDMKGRLTPVRENNR